MSTHSDSTDYKDFIPLQFDLSEYKQEEEYITLWKKIHDWNKYDIEEFRLIMLEALSYFRNLPVFYNTDDGEGECPPQLLADFLCFFDMRKNFLLYQDAEDLCKVDKLVFAIDKKGKCLVVNLKKNIPYQIIHIHDLY